MRFCDKLAKMRKSNNLSQEQLADRMNMSRQAISKWESGNSYPDMDKMLQLCKILNCNLEELMDDGVIGNNDNTKKKFDFNKTFDDFLNFITRSYNMFSTMSFKDKVKFILEMLFIALILGLASRFISISVRDLFFEMILRINYVGEYIYLFLSKLLDILLIIVSIIIFFHLYKIRYLDYYVTISDADINERKIEAPIDKPKNSDKSLYKEKVIIRDPKHSSSFFFEGLARIVIVMIKVFFIMMAVPVLFFFVLAIVGGCLSIINVTYNVIFLWIFIAFIGSVILLYVPINFIYNFVFNQSIMFKRNFAIFLVGLLLIGIGGGFTASKFMKLNYIDNFDDLKTTKVIKYVPYSNNTDIHSYCSTRDYEYVVDNNINDLKIEVTSLEQYKYNIVINGDNIDIYTNNGTFFSEYKLLLNDLEKNIIRNYNLYSDVSIKITSNETNINKLKNNN